MGIGGVGGLVVAEVRDKGKGYGEGKSGKDPGAVGSVETGGYQWVS